VLVKIDPERLWTAGFDFDFNSFDVKDKQGREKSSWVTTYENQLLLSNQRQ